MTILPDADLSDLLMFGTGAECERLSQRQARRNAGAAAVDLRPKQAHKVHHSTHQDHRPMWQVPDNVPLFTMATVARAVDVAPATIRAWFQRDHVRLNEGDTKAHINGAPNRFTLRSVLMLTVMAELVRQGSSPSVASTAAEHWMVHGVLEGQFGAPARRDGGGLFPAPFTTYLIAASDGSASASSDRPCQIVGIDRRDPRAYQSLFGALFLGGRASAKIVLLNLIDRRVRHVCHEAILGDGAPAEPDWETLAEKLLAADE